MFVVVFLFTNFDPRIYTLAAKPGTIARFAGKHVHIEGKLKDTTITVDSIIEMPHIMKM